MFSNKQREQIKETILKKSFELFVRKGLESTSINDIAEYCNTYKAALYNYFGSKDGIVIECSINYMNSLDEKLSRLANSSISTLRETLRGAFFLFSDEKIRMRFIYQVISSPNYGKESREKLSGIYKKYLDYSEVVAQKYNVPHESLRPYYLLLVATIHDFCLWENADFVIEKLNYILDRVQELEENK